MKQEEKNLLIKDLCARLLYGVILKTDNVFPQKLEGISFDKDTFLVWVSDGGFTLDCMDCKPYLFPLSSMTKEQENEWDILHFNPLDTILEGKFNGEERLQLISKSMADPIQWCYKNHFDCNGLIPLGLAIDCTNLNIY